MVRLCLCPQVPDKCVAAFRGITSAVQDSLTEQFIMQLSALDFSTTADAPPVTDTTDPDPNPEPTPAPHTDGDVPDPPACPVAVPPVVPDAHPDASSPAPAPRSAPPAGRDPGVVLSAIPALVQLTEVRAAAVALADRVQQGLADRPQPLRPEEEVRMLKAQLEQIRTRSPAPTRCLRAAGAHREHRDGRSAQPLGSRTTAARLLQMRAGRAACDCAHRVHCWVTFFAEWRCPPTPGLSTHFPLP